MSPFITRNSTKAHIVDTHKDHRLGFVPPALPLGPAIKRGKTRPLGEFLQEQRVKSFERIDHKIKGAQHGGTCTQSETQGRAAAQVPAGQSTPRPGVTMEQLEQVSSPAAPPFKVGDRVRWKVCDRYWQDCRIEKIQSMGNIGAFVRWQGAEGFILLEELEHA